MEFFDFEYDGKRLSDFQSTIGYVTGAPDVEAHAIGNQLTFNTIPMNGTNRFQLLSTAYTDAYTDTFQICKISCNCDNLECLTYNDKEISEVMRWLNRRTFNKFKPIYEGIEYPNIYYMASFNVMPIILEGNVYGFELSMFTNAPFGFYEPIEYKFEVAKDGQFCIFDQSDEIGAFYPDEVVLTVKEAGNLTLKNTTFDKTEGDSVVIHNCKQNEKITLDGMNKVITTSDTTHASTLFNDFNYNFLKIHNELNSITNIYTTTLALSVYIKYSPICKGGVI